ncbi:hypothetical protein LTR36_005265 [Oleoguttula mirabilis]|uniref:ubiquitinyl hydrolase 1 n=1 Tax=Oleoguttula mirabilis TaxID=1507867 RepID=A0AAV9JGI8_9PEZI|nr:hypothetical protein LTR36_005265 [Oleoguttula mirabilis]
MANTKGTYDCLINHIFLPPKLPHSDDGLAFDAFVKTASKAIAAFRPLRADQRPPLDAVARLLENMACAHTGGCVNEEKLVELLDALPRQGGTIVLHVSAQNAGVIISRVAEIAVRFEVFELAPRNEAVYATKGRLRRSFPGSAIDVDLKTFAETGFVKTTAHTLAKMSHQPAAGMQPQVKKARQHHDEDRDTTHPGMVSEFFIGFLISTGHSANVPTISKNTREEVLWSDARSPWRRSPVWLLLRVALQLNLPHHLYKELMVYVTSWVLKAAQAQNHDISSDLRYAMMSKISRRLLKIGSSINANVLRNIEDIIQDTTAVLDKQWLRLQAQKPLDLSCLSALDFEQDAFTAIPALDEYISSIGARQTSQTSTDFQPISGLVAFKPQVLPQLSAISSASDYANQNLAAFESWVASHIDDWTSTHKSDANACEQLGALIKDYHGIASRQYSGNPEAISVSHLTILQLWMALDVSATHVCSLLSDYKPGLSLAFAQNLLLPSKDQMRRLSEVEAYVASREAARFSSAKVLYDISSECLAARYFDRSPGLQVLLATIEIRAEQEKAAKIEELTELKSEYHRLMELHETGNCQTSEVLVDWANDIREDQHSPFCQKCAYAARAKALRIAIHEWPLPATTVSQKVVIFELQPPPSFVHWRDSLVFITVNVLKADHATLARASADYPLSADSQLSSSHSMPSRRIALLSQDKPHSHTHRKYHPISTATTDDVLLASGLNYRYYDNNVGTFVSRGGFVSTDKVPLECTYELPSRSTALKNSIFRPATSPNGRSPNAVIASLSECPDHMSLDEYKKLSSIPCGYHIQWPNLLIQLGLPAVNFKKAESTLVILQCIYQAGPPSNDIRRAGHAFAGDYDSAVKLLEELRVALHRVKKNWESSQALSIFISIASRLLSLSPSTAIQISCVAYLEDARTIAFGWIQDLREKAQRVNTHNERTEYLSKRAEIALICVDSFNIDDSPLDRVLTSSTEHASILVQCTIILQESKLLLSIMSEFTVQLLLMRSQRLLRRCHATLASNRQALDDGIVKSWTGFQPGSPWTAAGSDHWLTTTTRTGVAGVTLRVHFNILHGELLVNGLPLDRLPRKYEDHASYRTLFGHAAIEVMPTAMPGMDFAAKRELSGYSIHFGMSARRNTATNDLLLHASKHGERYELIPADLFRDIFPAAFTEEYIHWYNLNSGVVEFRPTSEAWNGSCSRAWILAVDQRTARWRLSRDAASQVLLGLTSATSKALSRILSPLADSTRIHVVSQLSPQDATQLSLPPVSQLSLQGLPPLAVREVEANIPGLQLGFTLKAYQSDLRCKEFPKMIVDPHQSLGALVGLENKLLLRQDRGPRVLLILDGTISHGRGNDNSIASVTVEKAAAGKFHTFRVDDSLGRLIGNGNLQSKLFLAYLHGLTSYCLPDPLTGKTGTEQALSILRSADVRSFAQLTEENIALLHQSAALTPVRGYYPAHERVMQTVSWSCKLGFLAQHAGFRTEVESILAQAGRLGIFYPDSTPLMPDLPKSESGLMQRDSIRYAMLRVSGFGAEEFTDAYDALYEARDQSQVSSRFSNAFIMSTYVYQHKQDLHWGTPSDMASELWRAIARTPAVSDHSTLSYCKLEYDASLFDKPFQDSVFPAWIGLNQRLGAEANKFSLMIWLSSLACSTTNTFDTNVLQTLALSITRPDVGQVVPPPPCGSFRLPSGKTVKPEELRTTVAALLVNLRDSPDFAIAKHLRETNRAYEKRRKQVYQGNTTPIVTFVVNRLAAQWPCKVPTAPNLSSIDNASAYIDITKVMSEVTPKFKAWYDNLQFFQYLERIGRIVAALPVTTTIQLPAVSLARKSPVRLEVDRYITQRDLFASKGPDVPDHSAGSGSIGHGWLALCSDLGSSNTRLETLIVDLQKSAADSKYEKGYVADLHNSVLELQKSKSRYSLVRHDGIQQDLALHLETSKKRVDMVYCILLSAVTPGSCISPQLDRAAALWSVRHWPRVSPTFFLQQLNRLGWPALDQRWKDAIVQYGLALTTFQRAERLVNVCRSGSDVDLINELGNIGHINWKPHEYPDSLLLEVESGILIREVQEQIAAQMRDPKGASSVRNAVVQLNMGEGKSSLIVPIVAAALANGSQLVRVVVAKPQSKQMAQMMVSKLGGLLDRRVYHMPFSRALKLSRDAADAISAMLRECMSNGGLLLVQPEHILSFKLMGLEMAILGEVRIGTSLLSMQDFFDGYSRDLVDESDENFSVNFEIIYTMGTQRPVDMSPERWLCIHEVLGLVRKFSQITAHELPDSLELTHSLPGRFPRTRILKADAQAHLLSAIALHICNTGLNGFPIARQPQAVRDAVLTYITKLDLTAQEVQSVEHSGGGTFWTESTKGVLLLLRGLFAAGILSFVFSQKRWRVNYGLDPTRRPPTKLAVPYRAKDNPSPRSEFSHPDVIVVLATLSYYYGGLEEADLATAFDHLSRSDQADTAYQAWVQDADDMSAAFSQLESINLRDKHQFTTQLLPCLRYGKATIDYFLANIVFPKEMKEFPHKLSASGWDIGKNKALPTTGFSGTNDSRVALPLHVKQMDLPAQKHTNALVLGYLLESDNSVSVIPAPLASHMSTSDAERLLDMVMKLDPPTRVILDVGAQILELSNIGVAIRWLALSDASVQAVVFFDEYDELSVVNRKGRVEVLQTSAFATQLDVCLVFLDQSHTRGTDLRLPETYRAAVTLGAGLTKDTLTQACMRMRKLGKGQTVVFCVPTEIEAKILLCTSKPVGSRIDVLDILRWVISETWTGMHRNMPLWAVQGVRFVRQNALLEQAQDNSGRTSLSQQQANAFLEDEAQSLEDRYRPSSDPAVSLFASDDEDVNRIKQRCLQFESLCFKSTTLQEEQERELSPEIEQERQVQKPAPAKPRTHSLHADLVNFVATGVILPGSQAWQPAFATLSDTTAARFVNSAELSEGSAYDLLVTMDFARTIDTGSATGGLSAQADSYQRPVQWILTAMRNRDVVRMMVISPFEAQELYLRIQASTKVALHLYTPRCNRGFRSLDHLDFFSVPHQPTPPTVHSRLVVQLNLFAGQLYMNNYQDFKDLCAYLGLATETAAEGWEIAADGFILSDDQGKVGGAGSRLTKSPVKFLQTLMTIRRDGEGVSKTDMGALLEGRLLRAEDFGE